MSNESFFVPRKAHPFMVDMRHALAERLNEIAMREAADIFKDDHVSTVSRLPSTTSLFKCLTKAIKLEYHAPAKQKPKYFKGDGYLFANKLHPSGDVILESIEDEQWQLHGGSVASLAWLERRIKMREAFEFTGCYPESSKPHRHQITSATIGAERKAAPELPSNVTLTSLCRTKF